MFGKAIVQCERIQEDRNELVASFEAERKAISEKMTADERLYKAEGSRWLTLILFNGLFIGAILTFAALAIVGEGIEGSS